MMKTKSFFALILLLCCTVFIACDKDNSTNVCEENIKEDCFCTEEYDPVCGCNDVTYSNACHAECASITDYTPGECP